MWLCLEFRRLWRPCRFIILLQESMSDDLYYPLDYHLCDLKVKGAVSDPWYWKRRELFSRDFPCSTVQPSWAGLEMALSS